MSIVGTRPPLISETNLYEPRHKEDVFIKKNRTLPGSDPMKSQFVTNQICSHEYEDCRIFIEQFATYFLCCVMFNCGIEVD